MDRSPQANHALSKCAYPRLRMLVNRCLPHVTPARSLIATLASKHPQNRAQLLLIGILRLLHFRSAVLLANGDPEHVSEAANEVDREVQQGGVSMPISKELARF